MPLNETLRKRIAETLQRQQLCLVVFDDDPTGIQTVHGCLLLTEWTPAALRRAFAHSVPMFYVLTNTRAMTRTEAEKITADAVRSVLEVWKELGRPCRLLFISRSDSTLRGHYPLETDVMKRELRHAGLPVFPVNFLIPAFIEVGRVTRGGVHYLIDGEKLIPVAETEFARDNVFAYHHSDLKGYIEEKTGRSDMDYRSLAAGETVFPFNAETLAAALHEAAASGEAAASEVTTGHALASDPAASEVTTDHALASDPAASSASVGDKLFLSVDAVDYEDLQRFALMLLEALEDFDGVTVMRSSSSLPKALGGLPDRPLLSRNDFLGTTSAADAQPLFIVGSHVKKTTAQLQQLLACEGTEGIEVDVQAVLDSLEPSTCTATDSLEPSPCTATDSLEPVGRTAPDGHKPSACTLLDDIEAQIASAVKRGKTPVVYTSRREIRLDDADARQRLGQQVSDFLVETVRRLPLRPLCLIAKGGITSHDILTKGLEVKTATVMGQILSGVPCIRTSAASSVEDLPYVIFPGNVGTESALAEVYHKLKA